MSATDTPFYTLAQPHDGEQVIKKSRFLAQAFSVHSPDEALKQLETRSVTDANHNCWAYRIGQAYRFNDDGEPSGSAGKPILAAIDGQQMDRVMVIVTRWFGGIKLGIGGLIRAYGGTAAQCLRTGKQVPIIAKTRLQAKCAYADLAPFKSHFQALDVVIDHEDFGAYQVTMQLQLPSEHADLLSSLLADITRGRGEIKKLSQA